MATSSQSNPEEETHLADPPTADNDLVGTPWWVKGFGIIFILLLILIVILHLTGYSFGHHGL